MQIFAMPTSTSNVIEVSEDCGFPMEKVEVKYCNPISSRRWCVGSELKITIYNLIKGNIIRWNYRVCLYAKFDWEFTANENTLNNSFHVRRCALWNYIFYKQCSQHCNWSVWGFRIYEWWLYLKNYVSTTKNIKLTTHKICLCVS